MKIRAFIVGVLCALCLLHVAEGAPHRFRVHPTPALNIFSIAEGPDGFLWLAAEDGLYRFDGFHFDRINSYPFGASRYVAFTRDGSLWCGGFEGLARAIDGKFRTVVREEVVSMAAYPEQVFVRMVSGFASISLDGSMQRFPYLPRRDLIVDPFGSLWFASIQTPGTQLYSLDPKLPGTPLMLKTPPGFQAGVRDARRRIWLTDGERGVRLDRGRIVQQLDRRRSGETRRASPFLKGQGDHIWFLGERVSSLTSPTEFRDRVENGRYPPVAGLEDSRGHLWVASFARGLVEWVPDPAWQRWFPEDLQSGPPVQMLRNARGEAVLATRRNLYVYRPGTDVWDPLAREERHYAAILALPDGGFLASIRKEGVAQLSADGRVVQRLQDPVSTPDEYREILRDAKGRIWVGHKRGLFRVEGRSGSFRLRREELPGLPDGLSANAVDLELDSQGRLWVGYAAGIASLDDQDQWRQLQTDSPVTLVRSFALAGDDIWVAHRRAGAFSRLHRNGDRWKVTLFPSIAGYSPLDTHFLKRDSRGWIWRGSPEGVHISDGRHIAPDDWLHIQLRNGLATDATDQYGFFEDADGSVWITGEQGLTHLHPDASWFRAPGSAPPPQVTSLDADGQRFLFPDAVPGALPSGTKVLRVHIGSLATPPFRDRPLRYRLLPRQRNWELSANGSLEFTYLPDEAYTLELGYAGDESSAVARYPLRIGSGGLRLSWLWLAGAMILSGTVVAVVRYSPWFDRTRYRIEKTVFLLRRRFGARTFQTSPGAGNVVTDYSGQTLAGHYRLERIVSRGGFSVVYEARDLRDSDARLAIKVLNRATREQSWIRDRFAHEVNALRSIEHPGVVRILDSWITPAGEPCLSMPFIEGITLRKALEEDGFPAVRVAGILRQLGGALADVHARGIVHRDLKPENLMLTHPGTDREHAVIIDFGTAGLRTAEDELAATTLMAGSFHYMAPERLTGHYSPASDVFSLAVIALEMLTGKRLVNLTAMVSDTGFVRELENALHAGLPPDAARAVAALLVPAYYAEPRRRPTDVKIWSETLAAALAHA